MGTCTVLYILSFLNCSTEFRSSWSTKTSAFLDYNLDHESIFQRPKLCSLSLHSFPPLFSVFTWVFSLFLCISFVSVLQVLWFWAPVLALSAGARIYLSFQKKNYLKAETSSGSAGVEKNLAEDRFSPSSSEVTFCLKTDLEKKQTWCTEISLEVTHMTLCSSNQ